MQSLSQAFADTRAVLANVKPDQFDEPTPCRSWTVRQLVNHFIAAPRFLVSALQTGEGTDVDEDFCAGDYLAAYDATRDTALAALEEEGAMQKMVVLPFAEVPGSFLMTMITTDQFAHAWDLARATGQPTDLDPALAEQLLAEVVIPEQLRGPEGEAPFGPEQTAPAGAGPADRLAAHLGRSV